MTDRKASIKLTPGCDPGSQIVVDGVDITAGVRAFSLTAAAGDVPELNLDMAVVEVEVDGEVRVELTDGTREALLALGWTPPQETP